MTKKHLLETHEWASAEDEADIRLTVLTENKDGEKIPVKFIPDLVWYREADNTLFITNAHEGQKFESLTKNTLMNFADFREAPDNARIVLFGVKCMQELESAYTFKRSNNTSIVYVDSNGKKLMFGQVGFTASMIFVNPFKPTYGIR